MAATRTIRDVRLTQGNRTFTGSYEVENGEVCVWGAHGSRRAKLGEKEPKALAEKLLGEILNNH